MTINDPAPHTTEIKRTYGAEPETTVVHHTEVRESSAGWWIGALVAIVAILAVVFLVTRGPAETDDVATALEQGRLQGALESTQANLSAAQDSAARATQNAADATAQASANAAEAARSASERAADAAATAADRVGDTVVIEQPAG